MTNTRPAATIAQLVAYGTVAEGRTLTQIVADTIRGTRNEMPGLALPASPADVLAMDGAVTVTVKVPADTVAPTHKVSRFEDSPAGQAEALGCLAATALPRRSMYVHDMHIAAYVTDADGNPRLPLAGELPSDTEIHITVAIAEDLTPRRSPEVLALMRESYAGYQIRHRLAYEALEERLDQD